MAETTEIEIDPSVLQERSDAYSSLTDINGADVFTDVYEEKVRQYGLKKQQIYSSVQEKVFVVNSDDTADIYEQVKEVMFMDEKSQILKDERTENSNEIGLAIPIIGVIFIIVILLLVRYVNKRKEKREKRNVDTYA